MPKLTRAIITGIPCNPSSWKSVFEDSSTTEVIALSDLIKNENTANIVTLGKALSKYLGKSQPTSIVAHDLGVTLALLGLLFLDKTIKSTYHPKLTLMNGAFRRFDLLKSSHPIRIQFKTFKQFKAITESMGGTVDPKFEQLYPHLKTIYQQVILSSLKNSLKRNLKTKTRPISISADIQVIGSENDPFIPKSSIHSLHSDLPNSVLVWKSFGHFPYSHFSKMDIRKTILEFESET